MLDEKQCSYVGCITNKMPTAGYTFRKQVVAVMGATGQVGTPLTHTLLELGHEVWILSRRESDAKLDEYRSKGAKIIVQKDSLDNTTLTEHLKGAEVLICAVPASKEIVNEAEPIWLECAVKAGVKRFVPSEFGGHTRNIDYGECVLFDWKKDFHKKLFASGIGWTLFFNGGIFDYFLPNLRFFRKITTFGNIDLPISTHEIEDIGKLAAMALTDDRTLNKCVQVEFNLISQRETVALLKKNFPDHPFEYEHFSSEYITTMSKTASNEITAKKGAETDRERWGINYCIYVLGKMHAFNDETLRASELYPNYEVLAKPEVALADPKFVFDNN